MNKDDRQKEDHHGDHQPSNSYLSKEESRQLIQAAGHKKSSEPLKELIQSNGYTARQLDAISAGKTPLQQACWKGTIESIRYLLEEVGCNVNHYSQQTYSYGKTAIFFALTQSRKEVVAFLLTQPNINVSIVNNKGQSVLSLAASHAMPETILQDIQSKEETDLSKWWNFRATHSDNLEYGDLDPRFLERPLKDTDVVTEYAVNGTTKQSRKGAFQRRNPEAAKEWQRHRQQQNQGKKITHNKTDRRVLSQEQQQAIDDSWQVLSDRYNRKDIDLLHAILNIVEQSDGLRKAWIPEMADRLKELGYDYDGVSRLTLAIMEDAEDPMNRARTTSLFLKLLSKLQVNDDHGTVQEESSAHATIRNNQNNLKRNSKVTISQTTTTTTIPTLDSKEWLKVALPLQHLSMSCLEQQQSLDHGNQKKELKLNNSTASIVFVNEYGSLRILWNRLQSFASNGKTSHPFVLAMDSEWTTVQQLDGSAELKLSTLQLGFCDSSAIDDDDETPPIEVYLVDLLVSDRNDAFENLTQQLVHWMIYGSSGGDDPNSSSNHCNDKMWLLGFALGHDLKMLRKYCNHAKNQQWRSQMLDLQMLLRERRQSEFPNKQLPGLKTCTNLFSSWELSKDEQRSDWSQRPLSPSQVQYAALDAAILLFLLAEEYRPDLISNSIRSGGGR